MTHGPRSRVSSLLPVPPALQPLPVSQPQTPAPRFAHPCPKASPGVAQRPMPSKGCKTKCPFCAERGKTVNKSGKQAPHSSGGDLFPPLS